jgi:hypothetical protein
MTVNKELETLLRQVVPNPHGLIDIPAFADKIIELLDAKQYTHLEMEAGLCVWECLCEWTLHETISQHHKDWVELREGIGSVELRHQSIVLGQWCLKIYNICTRHNRSFFDGSAYDWEVIPMILGYARNDEGEPVIYDHALPDPNKIAPLVAYRHAFDDYLVGCQLESSKQWGYREFPEDHPERVEQAFASNEKPAEFIKWLGEKYDLIPREEWIRGGYGSHTRKRK